MVKTRLNNVKTQVLTLVPQVVTGDQAMLLHSKYGWHDPNISRRMQAEDLAIQDTGPVTSLDIPRSYSGMHPYALCQAN